MNGSARRPGPAARGAGVAHTTQFAMFTHRICFYLVCLLSIHVLNIVDQYFVPGGVIRSKLRLKDYKQITYGQSLSIIISTVIAQVSQVSRHIFQIHSYNNGMKDKQPILCYSAEIIIIYIRNPHCVKKCIFVGRHKGSL